MKNSLPIPVLLLSGAVLFGCGGGDDRPAGDGRPAREAPASRQKAREAGPSSGQQGVVVEPGYQGGGPLPPAPSPADSGEARLRSRAATPASPAAPPPALASDAGDGSSGFAPGGGAAATGGGGGSGGGGVASGAGGGGAGGGGAGSGGARAGGRSSGSGSGGGGFMEITTESSGDFAAGASRGYYGPAAGSDTETLRQLFAARGVRVGTVARMNPFPDKLAPFYNDAQYRAVLAREFDTAIGIGAVDILQDGRYVLDRLDRLVDFARDQQIELHEQLIFTKVVIPPMEPFLERVGGGMEASGTPAEFADLGGRQPRTDGDPFAGIEVTEQDRNDAIQLLRDHVTKIMTPHRGTIRHWRVINEALNPVDPSREPLRESFWTTFIGPEYIELALQTARQVSPDAVLYINDYETEGLGPKSDAMYLLVQDLKRRGVPLDAVGLQMHVKTQGYPTADEVRQNIRRLGALGLEVYITEMDVALKLPVQDGELDRQAARFRMMAEVCLSEPACTKFFTWGFTDKYSWIPYEEPGYGAALIFDETFTPKPAYRALQDAARSP